MESYSQANQDRWVYEIFKDKTEGCFFVDIGAEVGTANNNSYILEKNHNWKGICIEASENNFNHLIRYRRSTNVLCAITDYNGKCKLSGFGPGCFVSDEGIEIECRTLETVLDEVGCPTTIDYLSIDIEGYEYKALKDFNFDKYFIKLITLEHNLYVDGPANKDLLYEFLTSKGFVRVVDNAICTTPGEHYNVQFEDWYVNSKCEDILNNPLCRIQPI
jgi:FkbM family methyltransferase